ncbi:MAG: type II toxin-antitoxin system VapC family toxin [Hyphomonadaceae bacterium]|nr:type II toxin-antitoxin system VapC family toxin [Hyphomonadaceae bacterium]
MAFLLDTHTLIWVAKGSPLRKEASETILEAANDGDLLLSPVTAWEIGQLSMRPSGQALGFARDPAHWFEAALARPGFSMLPLTPAAAILASRLPGEFHKDPADRLLVASAIVARATFVTRYDRIIIWARQTGAIPTLAC